MICQDTTIFQDTKVCEDTPVCRDATVCQDTTVYHDNDNTVYQETVVCQDTLREDQKCGSFLQSMIENTLTWGWEVLIFFLFSSIRCMENSQEASTYGKHWIFGKIENSFKFFIRD